MGLPKIDIRFLTNEASGIKSASRGVVAIILKDDTVGVKSEEVFKSIADVDFTKFTKRNYEYLKLAFAEAPAKVIVLRTTKASTSINNELNILKDRKFNYLCMPEASVEIVTSISAWIKEQRKLQKTFKAVLPNSKSDDEGIINFTTDTIKSIYSEDVFSTAEYCVRIAGLLASLDLTRTATYFILNDIISANTPIDADSRVDKGELVIVYDSENYKIARAVNSLTSFTKEKGEDFSKIKIIEGIDLYNDAIRETFEKSYIGKCQNSYDNKQMFIASVNAFNKSLEGDVLDNSFKNVSYIDIDAQKLYLKSKGKDTDKMSDIEILSANTGSKVFIKSNLKFVDAMEDLQMINYL